MAKEKRSFFERLTGVGRVEEREERELPVENRKNGAWLEEESEEGQLTVDVYQTPDDIIIKTIVAGVKPENLDVSITRDMVTIKGSREAVKEIDGKDYFHQELYWGSFSRTILLPQEIDVDGAEATERHGLLVIRLPKIDKGRQSKLKVRSSD